MPIDSEPDIDCNAFDLAHQTVRLSTDLSIWPDWEEGRRVYRLEHCETSRFFDIGPREYAFVSLLDGETTVSAACGLSASHLANEALTQRESLAIARWLLQEGLAELVGFSGRGRSGGFSHRDRRVPGSDRRSGLLKMLNPFWIRIPIVKESNRLQPFFRFLARPLHPWLGVMTLLLTTMGVVSFAINRPSVFASGDNWFSVDRWLGLLVTWCVLKVIHETGHATMCVRLGARVGEMGLVVVLFAPLAYVDVSSSWRLSRGRRILVSLAGMLFELAIASIAMLLWLLTDDPPTRFWLSNIIVVAGVSTVLFNANPLMRFDGYYVLSDLIGIPNLAGEGSQAMSRIARSLCYGESLSPGRRRGLRRWFVIAYGIAAAVWRLVIVVALSIAAAVMFSGAGIVIAILGLAACLHEPATSMLSGFSHRLKSEPIRCVRAVATLVTTTIIATIIATLPLPTDIQIAAVVEDPPGSIVRAGSDGFVSELFVENGEEVRRGDRLMRLENQELSQELKQLQIGLRENDVLSRMAAETHDPADDWTARDDRKAILEKIARLKPRVKSLMLLATKSGTVRCRELGVLTGRFVQEGDELLRLIDATPPDVIGMVHQDEIRAVRSRVGEAIQVYDARHQAYRGRLKVVDPRAVHDLQNASLAAPFGGPLSVVKSRDRAKDAQDRTEYRLTAPHFVATAELVGPNATELKSGMRVTMQMGPTRLSLATRLELRLRELWNQSYEDVNRSTY